VTERKRTIVWVQRFQDRPNLVLQWHDPDTGERKSKSAGTADLREAEDKAIELQTYIRNDQHVEPLKTTWPKFREMFDELYVAAKRASTRRNFDVALDGFERICKPAALASVNEVMVARYAARLRKQPGRRKDSDGMMASTIAVRLQFLHTALRWAVKKKLLASVPDFPTVEALKKTPQPVPDETFERLLAEARDDATRAFLLCGWLAGLRLTEAYVLEWEENEKMPYVDFARERIILPAEFAKSKRDDWVPLDRKLREALEKLPRESRRVFHFQNAEGQPLGGAGMSQRVQKLARLAGVNLTMKSLRRGFACRYAGRVSAQVLQKLMRHSDIKTTMKYYANIDLAVEEAVLGPKRNASRNNGPSETVSPSQSEDTNL
jgi:integrase